MPHGADAYDSGRYPYENGGMKGSAWAYDVHRNKAMTSPKPSSLLPPPSSSSLLAAYYRCSPPPPSPLKMIDVYDHHEMPCTRDAAIPRDAHGRCFKQDPMQGGSGKEAGTHYQIFSDFNAARVQSWLEGTTGDNGQVHYNRSAYLDGRGTSAEAHPRVASQD